MTITQTPSPHAASPENGYGLSLADVIRILRSRLAVILLVVVLLTGTAVGISLTQRPMYDASTTILIGEKEAKTTVDTSLQGKMEGLQQLTPVMAEAIDSRRVAQATIQRLDLRVTPSDFVKHLSAEQVSDTSFIKVKYRAPSPQEARRVANTIVDVFPNQVAEMNLSAGAITSTVWDQTVVSSDPVSPNPLRNGFMAAVLGLVLGVGLAFLLAYRDNSWRSPQELEQISGVPTFALIPNHELPSERSYAPRGLLRKRSPFKGETLNGKKKRD